MGKKSARKRIGNKFNSADSYARLKRKSNDNNQPWLNKAKRNKVYNINVEKQDNEQ